MNHHLPGQRNKKTIRRIYVEMNKYQLIKSVINHHSMNSIQLSDRHFLFFEVSRPDLSPGKVKSSVGLTTQLGLQVLSRFSHRKTWYWWNPVLHPSFIPHKHPIMCAIGVVRNQLETGAQKEWLNQRTNQKQQSQPYVCNSKKDLDDLIPGAGRLKSGREEQQSKSGLKTE